MSHLAVLQPLGLAWRRTHQILFEPFQLSKWLRLGFCVFLMGTAPGGALGGGGGGPQSRGWLQPFRDNDDGGGDSGTKTISRILDRRGPAELNPWPWIQEHLALILFLTFSVVAVLLVIGVLQTWLSSRARFMVLDGVVHNRGAILLPWRTYRREGNSLFRFRLLLGVISFGVLGALVAVSMVLGWSDIQASLIHEAAWSARATVVMIGLVGLLLIWFLAIGVVDVVLLDFVAPVMHLHRLPVRASWRPVLQTVVKEHPKGFALYILTKIVLNTLVSILTMVAILCTCCLAAVPYIGTVLLLPLSLLQLTYPLAFLEQLGPGWEFLSPRRPAKA